MDQLIGRDADLDELWNRLETANLRLQGPRRIGKSSLLRHAEKHPRDGWAAVYVDLEGVDDEESGARRIREHVEDVGSGGSSVRSRLTQRVEEVGASVEGGVPSIATLKLTASGRLRAPPDDDPWERLDAALKELLKRSEARVALFLDEVPWWLIEVERAAPRKAVGVLHKLAALLQHHDRLRVVLTGSVGFGTVLQRIGGANALRSVDILELSPLAPADGATLFDRSVQSTSFDPEGAALAARACGGSPHWIKVLAAVVGAGRADTNAVRAAIERLTSTQGHAKEFHDEGREYFVRRFEGRERDAARAAFGAACAGDGPTSREVLIAAALRAGRMKRREEALFVLDALFDSYYLVEVEGGCAPHNGLLAAWWRWDARR